MRFNKVVSILENSIMDDMEVFGAAARNYYQYHYTMIESQFQDGVSEAYYGPIENGFFDQADIYDVLASIKKQGYYIESNTRVITVGYNELTRIDVIVVTQTLDKMLQTLISVGDIENNELRYVKRQLEEANPTDEDEEMPQNDEFANDLMEFAKSMRPIYLVTFLTDIEGYEHDLYWGHAMKDSLIEFEQNKEVFQTLQQRNCVAVVNPSHLTPGGFNGFVAGFTHEDIVEGILSNPILKKLYEKSPLAQADLKTKLENVDTETDDDKI